MSTLIKNSRIVNEESYFISDVLIKDGIVKKIEHGSDLSADVVIDATGLYAIPGLFDIHVHLRDPGFCEKETILTGCSAAAAGGITGIAPMPNTSPVTDSIEVIEYIKTTAQNACCKVYPIAAITKSQQGDRLVEFEQLLKSGAVAFSDDGRWVYSEQLMSQALEQSKKLDFTIVSHCEIPEITKDGIMHLGSVSEELSVPGVDRESENRATARDIELAKRTGAKIHIAHVSTAQAVEIIRQAKRDGVRVTAETTPHYLSLTHEYLKSRDADYRMSPPLREQADVEAMINAVIDGTIDCIATDHAPHTDADKSDFCTAPNGVIGLETSLAAVYTYLVKPGHISVSKLIDIMSYKPREILGVERVEIKEGSRADICLFDPNEIWRVDKNLIKSKSKNTPFKGMKLQGRVKYTLLDGRVVYKD